MSAVPSFTSALAAAQGKEKFSPAVQTAAGKVNADALKAALDAVLAGGDDASVADAGQSAALKAGFEFATELVKMLTKDPGNDDKLKVFIYPPERNEERCGCGMVQGFSNDANMSFSYFAALRLLQALSR